MNKQLASLYQRYNNFQTHEGINLMNRIRIKPGDWILDIGCGTGELTYELAKRVTATGKIIALDPDEERLKIARDDQPADIQNIDWFHSTIEEFHELPKNSIDIIYSNYALHWVGDKEKAFQQIVRLLKPRGQLMMNCIADYSKIIAEIEMRSGLSYEEFQKKYPLMQKNEWLTLLKKHNFVALENRTINDFEFNSLEEFLIFWEATVNGKFKKDALSQDNYQALRKNWPSKIPVFGNETLSVLCQSLN